MKRKKHLALLLTGTLLFSMTIVSSAAESGSGSSANSISSNSTSSTSSTSSKKPSAAELKAEAEKAEARAAEEAAAAESRANALAAEELGLPLATLTAASEAGKSVGEFINNAVTQMPGLENTAPVAQGGGIIIDGKPSNQSFSVSKPISAQVESAKAQASALNGTILNVVDVDGTVFFENASVNFYMPGVTGTDRIQVLQFADGQWTPVTVTEIRADHVVVNMTDYGVLAFIQV